MTEQKIIAVVGATGTQGGGLVRAILADPDGPFAVRAITRDASSVRARQLADQGVEVVEANLDDEPSVRKAFDGAHGVFLVTNFWEQRAPGVDPAEVEIAQAAVGARAAKDAGVRHVIWSTLDDTRVHLPISDDRLPTLGGRYTVPHFDAKAEADQLFTDLGVPTTFLQTTMFFEAFQQGQGPHRAENGELVLSLAMGEAKLAGIAAEDIGKTALGILKRGDEFIGKTVSIAGDHLTGAELATAFGKALGEEVAYRPLTHDQLRGLGFPGADEIGNMFQYYVEAADYFTGVRDLDLVRELNPELQTFDTWLEANKGSIPTS